MAIPTVQDLIEELEEYGGHMPVRIVLPATAAVGTLQKRDEDTVLPLVIDDQELDGAGTVVLTPGGLM